jgi:hypothetical protein
MEAIVRKIVGLCWALVLLPLCCLAQNTTLQKLQTVGGFLEVCGREDPQLSKERIEAVAKAPPGEVMHAIEKVWAAGFADQTLCLGYLNGLYEGWEEGHQHGVLAATFPAGLPRLEVFGAPTPLPDLSTALKSLSDKELETLGAALENDVPCTPDHMTFGELKEVVVKYVRGRVEESSAYRFWLTSRMFPEALREAFPCPVAKPATPK